MKPGHLLTKQLTHALLCKWMILHHEAVLQPLP